MPTPMLGERDKNHRMGSWVRRRLPAGLTALLVAASGAAWAGCGGSDEDTDQSGQVAQPERNQGRQPGNEAQRSDKAAAQGKEAAARGSKGNDGGGANRAAGEAAEGGAPASSDGQSPGGFKTVPKAPGEHGNAKPPKRVPKGPPGQHPQAGLPPAEPK